MDKQTRSNHTNIQKYAIDLFLNFLIIFLSYILAALIRYYIFKPLYTLNPFALPFLIIIMIYSAFMAITLDYEEFPRVLQEKRFIRESIRLLRRTLSDAWCFRRSFLPLGL